MQSPKQILNAKLDAIAAKVRSGELSWQDAKGERDCAHEEYQLDLGAWNLGRTHLWPVASGYSSDSDD